MELPQSRGQLRRSIALQVGRDVLGWRRAARRIELDARRFRGRSRQRTERALARFLRGRDRRATGLVALLEAQGGDAAGRYVLRELARGQRGALSALRRLGEDDPAQYGSAEQTGSNPSPQVRQAPSSTPSAPSTTPEPGTLLSDRFDRAYGPNNLITNHYAYLHHTDTSLPRSPNWEVTNGTLFHRSGTGWTGNPTACAADRYSETCTGSATFRMRSRRADLGDVEVATRLRVNSQPAIDGRSQSGNDGISIWPRYESQYRLYIVNVQRRDGTVVVNKKCPGGTQNNGTYHRLDATSGQPIQAGAWRNVSVRVANAAGGQQTTVTVTIDGVRVVRTTDAGVGCSAITGSGRVGIRGDNTDFSLDDVLVKPL